MSHPRRSWKTLAATVAVAFTAVTLAACGGSRSVAPSTLHQGQTAAVTIQLKIPSGQAGSSHSRKIDYVSPGTQGLAIWVFPTGQGQPQQPTATIDVKSCAQGQGGLICTVNLVAPVGADSFVVSAYDQAPLNGQPQGKVLSTGTVSNIAISGGANNVVKLTLAGVIAGFTMSPSVIFSQNDGLTHNIPLGIIPLDPDGYMILQGPYTQKFSAAISNDPGKTLMLIPPQGGDPTAFTVVYNGATLQDGIITATAPGATAGVANVTPLNASPTSFTLAFTNPNQTANLSAEVALFIGIVYATTSDNNCAVTPSQQVISTPGTPVNFTVSGTDAGTCTVNLALQNTPEVDPIPVNVTGTGQTFGVGPSKIQHVIWIIQENRSFDNIFGGLDDSGNPFPGANTASHVTAGQPVPHDHLGNVITLKQYPLGGACYNPGHEHWWQVPAIDGGKMDGFDLATPAPIPCPSALPSPAPSDFSYQTLTYDSVKTYWTMGEQFALADNHFETISSGSFSEHLIAVSGQNGNIIDNPNTRPWGCDSKNNGTITFVPSLANTPPWYGDDAGNNFPVPSGSGPFPCFSWPTFADLMDQYGKKWLYYAPVLPDFGQEWSAYQAFNQIYNGPDWATHVISPPIQFVTDVQNGILAQMTWIVPTLSVSDHPRSGANSGPSYVAALVNAVGESKFWNSSAIIIIWDDWGGFYDHMPPPPGIPGTPGYGLRTGMIVISPYVKAKYVSHVFHTSASVLHFAEETMDIPSLGQYDSTSDDLSDMFNFNQAPLKYGNGFALSIPLSKLKHLATMPGPPPDEY